MKPGDQGSLQGMWVDSSLASAFDNESDGFIMIGRPKYKWLPRRLSWKFEWLMTSDVFPVRMETTSNPDVVKLTRREEEE